LSLALRSTQENFQIYPFLLSLLIILKIRRPSLYANFVAGRVHHEEIIESINSTPAGRLFLQDNYGIALEVQLAVCQSRDSSFDSLVKIYKAKSNDSRIEESERMRAGLIVKFIKDYAFREYRDTVGCLNYLVQKIDLVSHFDT